MGQPGKRIPGRLDLEEPQPPTDSDLFTLSMEELEQMSEDELNALVYSAVLDPALDAHHDRDAVISCILSHSIED